MLLTTLFELSTQTTKRRVMILWGVFFTLLGGLRWRIGGDWDQYLDHFLFSDWDNVFGYDRYGNGREKLEPGFVFVNALVRHTLGKFYWYNLLECGFIQFTIYKFCVRYSPRRPLLLYSWIVVAAFNYFPVRSGLSVGVVYWAYQFIQERKMWPFLAVVAAASLIHAQCLVMLPCYWIGKVRTSFKVFALIYIVMVINSFLFREYFAVFTEYVGGELGEKASFYADIEKAGGSNLSYASWGLNLFLAFMFYWARDKWGHKDDLWYNTLLNMYLLYMGLFIVFSQGAGELTRMTAAVGQSFLILYITTINRMIDSRQKLLSVGAVAFYLFYYLYKFSQIGSSVFFMESNVPYKTIFDYTVIH